jgi:peptide/nickel transport system substrate-binding protein
MRSLDGGRRLLLLAVLCTASLAGVGLLAATSTASSTTEQLQANAAAGSTLVVVSPVGVPSLDREAFGTSTQQEVLTNVGEPLLRFKPLIKTYQGVPIGSQTQFVGGACQTYTFTGKLIQCTLGHFVSPYGHTLTSADVKFTFAYMIAAKSVGLTGMSLAGIDEKNPITVISARKFNINLAQRNTTSVSAMTFWTFDPLDSKEVKKHATAKDPFGRSWLADHAAMFGPYAVTKFIANQEVDLAKNPNYRGNPSAGIPAATYASVVYRAVPNDGTRAQLLCSGSASLTKAINVNLYQPLKSCKSVTTYNFPYLAEPTLYFNVKVKPFDDANLRKAVDCAVNKQQISQSVYSGQWLPAHSIATPKLPSLTEKYDICPSQNLTKARAFLKASGYSGQTLNLYYSIGNSGQDAQENATLIQADLNQIGVKTSLQAEPDATKYFVGAISAQYGMFVFVWGANVPTAAWAFGAWFGPKSFLNATSYGTHATTRDLAALQGSALTSRIQTVASQDFQRQFMQNAVVDPLVYQRNTIIVNKSVCGLRSDPGDFPYWQFLKPCK